MSEFLVQNEKNGLFLWFKNNLKQDNRRHKNQDFKDRRMKIEKGIKSESVKFVVFWHQCCLTIGYYL